MSKEQFVHTCIDLDMCEINEVHKIAVDDVLEKMPQEDIVIALAELFKILGDPTRVRILWALRQRELCVCDLSQVIGMSQSAVSHQLRLLKQARLVRPRREGRVIYYRLDDDHVKHLFDQGLCHVEE